MEDIFSRFSPFIQDYIFSHGWNEIRKNQIDAAKVIFETENNLLLSSSTASGKTEAAFFPIISQMCDDMPKSFGVLYIAPLKSLINDQFLRLDELLDMTGIPVYHWHGDVSQSHKTKALANPSGILQITPESLEGMLINRSNDIPRIFADLRYIVIDEIHILMGSDRGNQIISQLCRIGHKIGYHPRRIGLSATIGDLDIACKWLQSGSGRETTAPIPDETRTKWRLGVEHFYIDQVYNESSDENNQKLFIDPGYEFIYQSVKAKKCLVFSNSREETEYVTATLRQIAKLKNERDRFLIHHGNLSAAIREETEMKLRNDEEDVVACATVTMELGIDIGKLERVVQIEAPYTVMSLLQRIGRSGRRENPPEMMMVFREETPLPNTPLPQLIPWALIRGIAIIQLYIEEHFIEPPNIKRCPFSLCFHQTLSVLASNTSLNVKELAKRVLTLPPFYNISHEDYKTLLSSMLENEYIEKTEEGSLIIGLKGEKLLGTYKFYAVFKDSEDYTVRAGSDEIGTITMPPPVGDRFALAGRVWEVEEVDVQRKLIYVHLVEGKMEIAWPGDYGEIHTKILQRMKKVLEEDTVYPYLLGNAISRLNEARIVARKTGILDSSCIHLGGYSYCLFPWLGTRSFRTLRRLVSHYSSDLKVSSIEYDGCYYITFKMENSKATKFTKTLREKIKQEGIHPEQLVGDGECPVFEKFDEYLPPSLLRKSYSIDRLRSDEIVDYINSSYFLKN